MITKGIKDMETYSQTRLGFASGSLQEPCVNCFELINQFGGNTRRVHCLAPGFFGLTSHWWISLLESSSGGFFLTNFLFILNVSLIASLVGKNLSLSMLIRFIFNFGFFSEWKLKLALPSTYMALCSYLKKKK